VDECSVSDDADVRAILRARLQTITRTDSFEQQEGTRWIDQDLFSCEHDSSGIQNTEKGLENPPPFIASQKRFVSQRLQVAASAAQIATIIHDYADDGRSVRVWTGE
jgi:hypothetical protein